MVNIRGHEAYKANGRWHCTVTPDCAGFNIGESREFCHVMCEIAENQATRRVVHSHTYWYVKGGEIGSFTHSVSSLIQEQQRMHKPSYDILVGTKFTL